MSGPKGERCGDCYNWEPKEGKDGICRVNAPSPAVVPKLEGAELALVWPLLNANEHCIGDFEPAEKKPG